MLKKLCPRIRSNAMLKIVHWHMNRSSASTITLQYTCYSVLNKKIHWKQTLCVYLLALGKDILWFWSLCFFIFRIETMKIRHKIFIVLIQMAKCRISLASKLHSKIYQGSEEVNYTIMISSVSSIRNHFAILFKINQRKKLCRTTVFTGTSNHDNLMG